MLFVFLASWLNPLPKVQYIQSLKVEVSDSQEGTAVLIDEELALTAAHVLVLENRLATGEEINVYCNGVKYKGSITKIDLRVDLALLHLSQKCLTVPAAKIAKENPVYASDIFVVSCPNGNCGLCSHGIVSGYTDGDKTHGSWFFSDSPIFFGSSGGGAWSREGELLGICHGVQNFTKQIKHKDKSLNPDILTAAYSIFITASEIHKFLGN